MLTCPVCHQMLDDGEKTRTCPNGHCYDRCAKGGYVNLLPSNRKGSSEPGDNAEMVHARTAFLAGGWYNVLRDELAYLAGTFSPKTILDAGCGEGYYTAAVQEATGAQVIGIDLSKTALQHAGRLAPHAELAVASLFEMPVEDESVDLVMNVFAPMCEKEFARVLKPGGTLMTVVPDREHLFGMKEVLYDEPYENDAEERDLDGFAFIVRVIVDEEITLTKKEDIEALFKMTPYAWKTGKEGADRLLALGELTTKVAFAIDLYAKQ